MKERLKQLLNDKWKGLYKWQQECLTRITEKQGIIIAPTGSGKTTVGIMLMLRMLYDGKPVLIVAPTKVITKQWHELVLTLLREHFPGEMGVYLSEGGNYDKYSFTREGLYVDIAVINTVRDIPMENYGLLIMDEAHHYQSKENRKIWEKNVYNRVIGLSATVEEVEGGILEHFPVIYKYNLEEAKEDGVVNSYTIINAEVDLTGDERLSYEEANKKVASGLQMFNGSFDKALKAVKESQYPQNKYAGELLKNVGKRKRIALSAVNKIEAAKKLIAKHKDEKIIVFAESIADITILFNSLGGYSRSIYHSKLSTSEKMSQLNNFNAGYANIMLSAKALDEGYDIKEANIAIIMSGSSSRRQAIQRIGRVIRPKEGKDSIIYQLYTDTIEKKWIAKRVEGIKTKWLKKELI